MTAFKGPALRPTKIYCSKSSDIPSGSHWAIIEFSTRVDNDGDQFSSQQYTAYTDQDEWGQAVINLMNSVGYSNREFVAIKATRAEITTTVKVAIS